MFQCKGERFGNLRRRRKALAVLTAVVFTVCGATSLFLPLPKAVTAAEEKYLCGWQDGSVSEETYASAYRDIALIEDGKICLLRNGAVGEIVTSNAYGKIAETVRTGSLAELLSLPVEGVTRLEQLAIWRLARERIWCSENNYIWNGKGLSETNRAKAEHFVLVSGSVSAARLNKAGAKHLELRAEAEIDYKTMVGTSIERVSAYSPYRAEGGAVYLNTGTAIRLVGVIPNTTALTVEGNDFADEGALLAAQNLQSLTLPFAGNAPEWSQYYKGEVAYLFSDKKEYFVPPALKRIKITGGLLVSHAFYRMNGVEEIDLCGMDAASVAYDALADCTALQCVHSPRKNLTLSGEFVSHAAPCGCTVFERVETESSAVC